MIICPPSLVRQHIGEIIEKTNSLRIALYYRDYRVGEEYGPRVQKIDTPLTKGHAIFNGDEDNDRLVIITTRQTLTIRHGTTALTDWRVEHGWTRERAEAGCFEPDPTWDRDISGEVEVCAVDECHEIKSKASKAASTIRLLGAVFYLLASGTPISNRVDDCGGYSHLIEPANADDLWSAQRLTAWNVTADVNPYELPLGHPAAILRTTERAANKFIFSHTVNDIVKGIRLEKLWEVCLISRRYDSIVPGTNDMKIAQYIPDVARKTMTLSFTDDERRVYEDYASVPLKKLIRPMDDNSGRVMWNMKYFRRLLMLSTWFGFHHIGHLVQHDSLGKWRLEANIIHTWLARVKVTEPVSPLPAKDNVTEILAVMCRASPKIRMILHVVADKIVLKQRKVIIWYLIPAHQLLVFGLLQLLRIPAIMYASDLDFDQRNEAVAAFQRPGSPLAFICKHEDGLRWLKFAPELLRDDICRSADFEADARPGRGPSTKTGSAFRGDLYVLACARDLFRPHCCQQPTKILTNHDCRTRSHHLR